MESRLRTRIPLECYQFFNRVENSITDATSTIVIHKSRNHIGTLGIAEFGPKYGQIFQINVMSLC